MSYKKPDSVQLTQKYPVLSVATDPQSYVNIIYLLLAFPFGLFYFVFLVTGLSVGIGLVPIGIGLLLLPLVFVIARGFVFFEREMANSMLGVALPPLPKWELPAGFWSKFKAIVLQPFSARAIIFLVVKFVFGVITFSLTVSLVSTSLFLLTMPLHFHFSNIGWQTLPTLFYIGSMLEALLASVAGLVLGIVTLHINNGLTALSVQFLRSTITTIEDGK